MNVWSVTALGIGAMVGAGIFALLGQAALIAHGDVWIAFIIGGVVAMFSGYSFARLSEHYPSETGVVAFFNAGFPNRVFAGSQSVIHLMTLATASALIAKSFGGYASRLVFGEAAASIWVNVFGTAIVIALALLNAIGPRAVGRAEIVFVGVKLVALGTLLIAGSRAFQISRIETPHGQGLESIVAAAGLIFFAYAGYGVMANASGAVSNARFAMPRAIYGSIGFVMVLYVAISIVVLANVSEKALLTYADTAVAQAAKPILGDAGFVLLSIAALLATASAINAMFFSGMNISYGLGVDRQLPRAFTSLVCGKLSMGVVISIVAILILMNVLDLSSIADIASGAFLITYLAVFAAHWRLVKETSSSRIVIAVGFILMAIVFVIFELSVYHTDPISIIATVALVVLSVLVEMVLLRKGAPTQPNGSSHPHLS